MNWAKFGIYTFLLITLGFGGFFLAIKNKDAELRTADISVFSGVAGAFIQLLGSSSIKKIMSE